MRHIMPDVSVLISTRSLETIATLGSKEGFANLAQAISAPGDVIVVPNPSYPIHAYGFIIAGAALRHVPVGPNVDFMAELERAVQYSVPPPLALVLNFPANPTAMVVDLEFYERVVAFCKKHDIIIISDLAYAEIYFDGNPPPSILQVPGARDIAVEFTSLSKTYSMPGWRMGFATGNSKIIAALARIKSYLDYGAFTPIQVAATAALNGPQDCVDGVRGIYQRRRDVLVEAFGQAGWDSRHLPRRCSPGPDSRTVCPSWLPGIFQTTAGRGAGCGIPGLGFGEYGDSFVRISLVENRQRIRQAARNVKQFFADADRVLERSETRATASGWDLFASPLAGWVRSARPLPIF